MMKPMGKVHPRWVNRATNMNTISGDSICQWPGPVIAFAYGYDISNYLKVDPDHIEGVTAGVEQDMTDEQIWNEISALG